MPKSYTDCCLTLSEMNKVLDFFEERTIRSRKLNFLLKGLRGHGFEEKDNFKVGLFLASLLQDPTLFPGRCQRISALFLLYELYKKCPLANNPFALVFNDFLQRSEEGADSEGMGDASRAIKRLAINCHEQRFLSKLVTSTLETEIINKTPASITSGDGSKYPLRSDLDISNFQLNLVREHSQRSVLSKSNITNIMPPIYPGQPKAGKGGGSSSKDRWVIVRQIYAKTEHAAPLEQSWRPEYIRPIPPLHPCDKNELAWMNPPFDGSGDHHFQWDEPYKCPDTHPPAEKQEEQKQEEKCVVPEEEEEEEEIEEEEEEEVESCYNISNKSEGAEDLIEKACRVQLSEAEMENLKIMVKTQPLLAALSCSANQIRQIVDVDVKCAFILLDNAMSLGHIDKYLPAMINFRFSIHPFRVVHRLVIKYNLPEEFSNLFISLCMEALYKHTPGSKRDMLARCMASLLLGMVKKDHHIHPILLEIRTFCIRFYKHKKVDKLWKLVGVKSCRKWR